MAQISPRLKEILGDAEIVHVYEEEQREPEEGPSLDEIDIHPDLRRALRDLGIEKLYKFQAEAIEAVRRARIENKAVVISAFTGAGKTEAFLIPILDDILRSGIFGRVSALLMYPTKALSRDQASRIERLVSKLGSGIGYGIYDGDTPPARRRKIREHPPQILITNPDMLHRILMNRRKFGFPFFGDLRFVVLDEIHTYKGVFGTHVHYILRRLERVCSIYGSKPIFIGASATIGNPREFARKLFSRDVILVETESGKHARRIHVIALPKKIDGSRRSPITEAISILERFHRTGMKTLVFADSHGRVERLKLMADERGLSCAVHRAGLPKDLREQVEKDFRKGRIRAVFATPTLELGIDIGDVDSSILIGFPPTYSQYLQRVGRAGRRMESLNVIIAQDSPLDFYYVENPDEFFRSKPEPIYIEPRNEHIASVHIMAAIADNPLEIHEIDEYFHGMRNILEKLVSEGRVIRDRRTGRHGILKKTRRKLFDLNIRRAGRMVRIVDRSSGKILGEREMVMAIKELFPGAIYLINGRPYYVEDFDEVRGVAYVESMIREKVRHIYTQALWETDIEIIDVYRDGRVGKVPIKECKLEITETVTAYLVKNVFDDSVLSKNSIPRPLRYSYVTNGLYLDFGEIDYLSLGSDEDIASAFHALEHVMIGVSPMITGADRYELGGLSSFGFIYIYEGIEGGAGISQLMFDRMEEIIRRAVYVLENCKCKGGCPRCVMSPKCGNNNEHLHKEKALQLARISFFS